MSGRPAVPESLGVVTLSTRRREEVPETLTRCYSDEYELLQYYRRVGSEARQRILEFATREAFGREEARDG